MALMCWFRRCHTACYVWWLQLVLWRLALQTVLKRTLGLPPRHADGEMQLTCASQLRCLQGCQN